MVRPRNEQPRKSAPRKIHHGRERSVRDAANSRDDNPGRRKQPERARHPPSDRPRARTRAPQRLNSKVVTISHLREPTKYAAVIHRICKLLKAHISNREIVVDRSHLRGGRAKLAATLLQ